jgi:hypothetical protein
MSFGYPRFAVDKSKKSPKRKLIPLFNKFLQEMEHDGTLINPSLSPPQHPSIHPELPIF